MIKSSLTFIVLSFFAEVGQAATYSFTTPTTGVSAPEKVGEFVYTGPTSYYPSSMYLDSSLNIPPINAGDSISKVFTVISDYASPLTNITASVVTSTGNYGSALVSCSPPLTTTSTLIGEPCDIVVSFSRYNEDDEELFITIKGFATTNKYVESTFYARSLSVASASAPSLILTPSPSVSFPDTGVNQESSIQFSVLNSSDSTEIQDLVIFTDSPYFNISGSSCYSTLPPATSCLFNVTMSAGDLGDYVSTLVAYASNSSNGVQSTLMSGSVVGEPVLVEVSGHSSSLTLLEGQSSLVPLVFKNQGIYKAVNSYIEVAGDNILTVSPSSTCGTSVNPITLQPSDTCEVPVSVSSLTAGSYSAFVSLLSDKTSASSRIDLIVNPAESRPEIYSGSLDFGSMTPNQVKSVTVSVINNGFVTAPAAFLSIPSIPGLSVTSNTCGSVTSTTSLAVHDTCELTLSFSSASAVNLAGNSVETSGFDYPLSIPILGDVSAPTAIVTLSGGSPVAFGSVVQNTTNVVKAVSIQNTGNSPLTISSVTGLPSAVTLTGNTCSAVAANATCSLTFTMSTATATSFSGTTVTTVGGTSNSSFAMSGTVATATRVFSLQSSTATAYGSVVSPNSVPNTFVFTNTGNTAIAGVSVTLTPAVSNFTISSNTCGTSGATITLAPSATCSMVGTYGGGSSATTLTGSSIVISGTSVTSLSTAVTGTYTIPTTIKIATGISHSCALLSTGIVKCWGQNGWGQLGNNTQTDSTTPVQVSNLTSVVDISVSSNSYTSCAVTSAGAAYCWGAGGTGQIGNGGTNYRVVPTAVTGLTAGVTDIASGTYHTCAVQNGAAKCWGSGGYGKLGNGTTNDSLTAVSVSGLTSGVVSVTAGESHSCAILSSGAVRCWGGNSYGQLGNNSANDSTTPVQVSNITSGASLVSAGTYHTCAVQSGAAKCWGSGGYGKLGNNSGADSLIPVQVSGLTSGVTALSAGVLHSCAVQSVSAKCWGGNGYGKLGNNSTNDSLVPVQVSGLTSGVSAISGATYHSCSALSGTSFRCWGSGGYGKLGNGSGNDSLVPVSVNGL